MSATIEATPRTGATPVLRSVIARAASPEERTTWRCFRPVADSPPDREARRATAWAAAAAGGDDAFRSLLAFRGISEIAWRDGLREVTYDATDPRAPQWARALRELFGGDATLGPPVQPFTVGDIVPAGARRGLTIDPRAAWSLHEVFEPLLRVAARRLAGVEPRIARQMLIQLARRWTAVASSWLTHRVEPIDLLTGLGDTIGQPLRSAVFGGRGSPADQWLVALDAFPVLGRLLAVAYDQWSAAIHEVLGRLAADRPRLEAAIADGKPLGALTDYHADAGDAHDGGRTVTILTFASGARIVYKPKDLRIAALYMELLDLLHATGLEPRLHQRPIVLGADYAWEAFVPRLSCTAEGEVRRFYRRMGMHARLIQLFDGADFTADNVVAHGEWPVLVDLEMLMSARMPSAACTATERELERRSWDSPCRSGLVTAKIAGDPGRRPAEMGALGRSARQMSPFKQDVVRYGDDGLAAVVRDYAPFGETAATALLHGESVDAERYFDEVVAGYRIMSRCLARAAPRLVEPGGILDRFGPTRVRFLCRDTHVYTRLWRESCQPARLRDGVEREICLERLWRGRFRDPAVVASEIDALRALDIPLFTSRTDRNALEVPGRCEVAGFFDGAALDRVRSRLAALPANAARESDAISTALFTLAPSATPRARRTRAARAAPFDPVALATRIVDAILREQVTAGDGELGWLGLTYHPTRDSWDFGVLGHDLLTGTAGIAVVAADLYRITGHRRFAAAARSLVARSSLDPLSLYARARVATSLGDSAPVPPVADPAVPGATTLAALALLRLGRAIGREATGRELLDGAEVALAAGDMRLARRLAKRLANGRRRTGRWFPESWAADRYLPSALLGTGAVAHLMMRLHDPSVPSLRALA